MVYSRKIDGRTYTFGVSGRLYKSNVLLYDHQTESLWSQLLEKSISGPLAGKRIKTLPYSRVKWKSWKKRHPDTLVLSDKTGYQRDYTIDPYENYYRMGSIWFPVGDVRKDLSPKEMVLGIEINKISKAYAMSDLKKITGELNDTVGTQEIAIEIGDDGEVLSVKDIEGNPQPHMFAYWFAWQAFHPETQVYKP